ncbi:MAG: bifunctional UDP-N-acetylmuramoyl-tripeptide:D-alanyl-D-alanine ligase/alanine racemase [Saprospiraceae bacterium]
MIYSVRELAAILDVSEYNTLFEDVIIKHTEIDSRYVIKAEETIFFALKGNQLDGHEFVPDLIEKGVQVFVVSNDIKIKNACFLIVPDVLRALQKLASYHRSRFLIPVIGITGSNGKTIVKEWLNTILQEKYIICKNPKSFNSQLGVALSVLELNESHQLGIFEAGISKPCEMDLLREMIQPTIGIITNIGDAHQAGFSGMDEKTKEKLILFNGVQKLIYCKDYQSIEHHRKQHLNNRNWSQKLDADYNVVTLKKHKKGLHLKLKYKELISDFELNFQDEASLENILHCIVLALELQLTTSEIQAGINQLHNLTMRLEQKEGINGCILINDSYSLDFKSLQLALQFVDQQNQQLPRTLVLTDFAEQKGTLDLWPSVEYLLEKYKIQKLIGVGKEIKEIKSYLTKQITFLHFESTEKLIENFDSLYFKNELILIKGARKFKLEQFFQQLSLSKHDTILEIDLKAITHNVNIYKSYLKEDTKIMAVVKAAAYGSGQYEIARLLEHKNIDYFAVAYPDEGILLRQKGILTPILVMNTGTTDFNLLLDHRLEPEIFSLAQCQRLITELGKFTKFDIHLKLDSGMHRLGFLENEIEALCQFLISNRQLTVKSIFSHLSGSDQSEFDDFTKKQAALFKQMADKISQVLNYKPLFHILNSGGIARHPDLCFDMIRLGIGMYGIDNDPKLKTLLEKAHTLKTRVSQIKILPAGETVSYNRSGTISESTKVAVLAIGYADGLPRIAGLKAYKLWANRVQIPLIGVVCMDMCMADVSQLGQIEEGMEIEVFGKNAAIESLAKIADTIPYEILCGISTRVKRIFLQD